MPYVDIIYQELNTPKLSVSSGLSGLVVMKVLFCYCSILIGAQMYMTLPFSN